jgi:ribose 5-phosphate isomerase B
MKLLPIGFYLEVNMQTNTKNPEIKEDTNFLTLAELQSKVVSVPKRIGVAADHGGFELKEHLIKLLLEAGYEVFDFGNSQLKPDDDYPDYVVPLANAIARGEVDRGVAVCGSGVGACVAMNKVMDVRACLVNDTFSARQGVEDDNLNALCLGGRVIGHSLAWELVKTFLNARFSGEERHRRRLAKVTELENDRNP